MNCIINNSNECINNNNESNKNNNNNNIYPVESTNIEYWLVYYNRFGLLMAPFVFHHHHHHHQQPSYMISCYLIDHHAIT